MAAKHYDGLLLRLDSYFPSIFFTLYYLVPDSTFLDPQETTPWLGYYITGAPNFAITTPTMCQTMRGQYLYTES